jgi:hypothetical protein
MPHLMMIVKMWFALASETSVVTMKVLEVVTFSTHLLHFLTFTPPRPPRFCIFTGFALLLYLFPTSASSILAHRSRLDPKYHFRYLTVCEHLRFCPPSRSFQCWQPARPPSSSTRTPPRSPILSRSKLDMSICRSAIGG